MPVCVHVIPAGTHIGVPGPTAALLTVPVIGEDPSCSAGLQLLTDAEIQANKSQLTVDTASNPERVQDMTDLFYAFLLALVLVWGVKQLLNLFTGDTSRD